MSAVTRSGVSSNKWQRLLSVLVAVAALGGTSLMVAPGAQAREDAWCSNPPVNELNSSDYAFIDEHEDLKVFHVRSLAETFVKSDGDFVDNLSNPIGITGHFTVNDSKTTSISTTVSLDATETSTAMGQSISRRLGVSTTVSTSVTTQVGKSVDFPVPANTYVGVDYGIKAYDVVYDLDTWEISDDRCWYLPEISPHGVHVVAPTPDEGFRFNSHT